MRNYVYKKRLLEELENDIVEMSVPLSGEAELDFLDQYTDMLRAGLRELGYNEFVGDENELIAYKPDGTALEIWFEYLATRKLDIEGNVVDYDIREIELITSWDFLV